MSIVVLVFIILLWLGQKVTNGFISLFRVVYSSLSIICFFFQKKKKQILREFREVQFTALNVQSQNSFSSCYVYYIFNYKVHNCGYNVLLLKKQPRNPNPNG